MEYLPVFPDRFDSLARARHFLDEFVHAYINHRRHTGIGMHTSADVHYGLADRVDLDRDAARRAYSESFTAPSIRPKILDRNPTTWINQPPTGKIQLAA